MNKVLKKIALSMSTVAALCFAVIPANAAGSIVANGTTTGQVMQDGKIVEGSTSRFEDAFTELNDEKVLNEIEKLNAGTKLTDALMDETIELNGLDLDLKEFSLLTKVQNLVALDKDGKPLTENVTVSWEVPNLTKEVKDVYVLHYSVKESKWEVIKPESVDYDKKEVTTNFKSLSPVAVIYRSSKVVPQETPGTSTQTYTGVYLLMGAAAVVLFGIVAYKKKATK